MCDASDYVIGVVLGQSKDKKNYAISHARKTLTGPQLNYTTMEKELLTVVFAIKKFRSYLVGAKDIVYTDQVTLKYLLTKKDAKPCLIKIPLRNLAYVPKSTQRTSLLPRPRSYSYRKAIGPKNQVRNLNRSIRQYGASKTRARLQIVKIKSTRLLTILQIFH
jgi:hypothetical protein